MRAIRTDRWKLIVNLNASQMYVNAMTNNGRDERGFWSSWVERAKTDAHAAELVRRYQHRPPVELYDLEADPYEAHTLADDPAHAAIRKPLSHRIDAWRTAPGENMRSYEHTSEPQSPMRISISYFFLYHKV